MLKYAFRKLSLRKKNHKAKLKACLNLTFVKNTAAFYVVNYPLTPKSSENRNYLILYHAF